MNGEIIAIGRELLMGEIADTNTAFFSQELAKAGVNVRWASQVGDDLQHLRDALSGALVRSEIIITSGGLGPTSDDLTREAVANVLGETLSVDSEMLSWIQGVFRERGIDPMPPTNIKQANLIPSASFLPNPGGTAPGWWVQNNGHHIFLTPGPPREIKRMWYNHIGPAVRRLTGAGIVFSRTLKTAGMTEGGIDEVLHDLFGDENPYLGIYARPDGIHLRIISRAASLAEAEALATPLELEIKSRIGHAVWGVDDDSAASRLGATLLEAALTVGIVESGTGGMLAAMVAETPGHEKWFRGSFVVGPGGAPLSTPLLESMLGGPAGRLTGAVSESAALQMANAARQLTGALLGIGVTPSAGEDDELMKGTLFVGLTSDDGQKVLRGRFYQDSERAIRRAAMFALTEATNALNNEEV